MVPKNKGSTWKKGDLNLWLRVRYGSKELCCPLSVKRKINNNNKELRSVLILLIELKLLQNSQIWSTVKRLFWDFCCVLLVFISLHATSGSSMPNSSTRSSQMKWNHRDISFKFSNIYSTQPIYKSKSFYKCFWKYQSVDYITSCTYGFALQLNTCWYLAFTDMLMKLQKWHVLFNSSSASMLDAEEICRDIAVSANFLLL